eukprot:EG_transcript_20661
MAHGAAAAAGAGLADAEPQCINLGRPRTRAALLATRKAEQRQELTKFDLPPPSKPHPAVYSLPPKQPARPDPFATPETMATVGLPGWPLPREGSPLQQQKVRQRIVSDKPNRINPPPIEVVTPWSWTKKKSEPMNQCELAIQREAFTETLKHSSDDPLPSSFSTTGFFHPEETKSLSTFYHKSTKHRPPKERPPWVS